MILESINVKLSNRNLVQIVIRHAIKTDLSMIWENFNSVVGEKKFIPVISEITNKYEQESWFYNHQNENNIVLVATIDEKVVGHCTIEHIIGNVANKLET
ncbi:MAG: hypothetical protein HWN67_09350 [Candidatus Helarchaeota archaeon]|nr:hypothetical protein [Candidatus Helarchaeota archaeon]